MKTQKVIITNYFSTAEYTFQVISEKSFSAPLYTRHHGLLSFYQVCLVCGSLLYITYDCTAYAILHKDLLYIIEIVEDESCSNSTFSKKKMLHIIQNDFHKDYDVKVCSAIEWEDLLTTLHKVQNSPILFVEQQLKNYA